MLLFKRIGNIFVSELKSDANPEKVARSFSLGIFFGIFPIFGLQTAAAILFAKLLKLNRPVAIAGSLFPLALMIPIIFVSIWLGLVIWPPHNGALREVQMFAALFAENKSLFLLSCGKYFITGCVLISIIAAALAYAAARLICWTLKKKDVGNEKD